MSESQAQTSVDKVKSVKEFWKTKLKKLSGPFNYEKIRDSFNDSKYWFKLPDEVLTFEGYIKILGHLQNIRTDFVKANLMIDEHAGLKRAALKNMEKILPGIFTKEECPTDKIREAKAAEELKEFTAIVEQANALQKTVYSILNNIDSAIAQVNRQMKSVDMGIRTQSIITASASDWDNSEEFDEESSIMNDCNHSELDEE